METRFFVEERYVLELEHDTWVLYREAADNPYGYIVRESQDINEIFIAMYRGKASRGNGSSMRIG